MIINIPNVGEVEFPDSMSQADINAAAKRLYDQNTTPKRQMKWVGNELVDVNDPAYSTANMPAEGVRNVVANVGGRQQEIKGMGGYAVNDLRNQLEKRNTVKIVGDIQAPVTEAYTPMTPDMMNPFAYLGQEQQTEAGPALQQTGSVVNQLLRSGAGIAQGAVINPVAAVAQVLGGEDSGGRKFAEDAQAAYQQQRQAAGGEGFDWAQLFGAVVSPVNRLIPTGTATGGSLIKGSIGGAMFSPVEGQNLSGWDVAKGKAEQAAVAGLGGAAFATLLPAFKVGAKKLLDEGVQLSTGQAFGGLGGNIASSAEFLMDTVRKAIGKDVSADTVRKTFTYAAVNEALAPIQKFIPKASEDGFSMVNQAMSKFKTAYPQAFEKVGTVAEDLPFRTAIGDVLDKARSEFSDPENYDKFVKEMQTNIINKFNGAAREIDGKNLHQMKRWLQAKSKNLSKGTAEDDVVKASLYSDIVQNFTDFTHRVDTTGVIKATDKAYANMLRIAEAAKQSSRTAGNFGPDKLGSVSASMAPGLSGGQGVGPLQQYAKEAGKVVGDESGDILTVRNLKNAGLLAGAGVTGAFNLPALGSLGITGATIEAIGALAKKNPELYNRIRAQLGIPLGMITGVTKNEASQ